MIDVWRTWNTARMAKDCEVEWLKAKHQTTSSQSLLLRDLVRDTQFGCSSMLIIISVVGDLRNIYETGLVWIVNRSKL